MIISIDKKGLLKVVHLEIIALKKNWAAISDSDKRFKTTSSFRTYMSFLAQLVERVTSNDEVSRSSRLGGILFCQFFSFLLVELNDYHVHCEPFSPSPFALCNRYERYGYRRCFCGTTLKHSIWVVSVSVRSGFKPLTPHEPDHRLAISHPLPILNISEHLTRLKLQQDNSDPFGSLFFGSAVLHLLC